MQELVRVDLQRGKGGFTTLWTSYMKTHERNVKNFSSLRVVLITLAK